MAQTLESKFLQIIENDPWLMNLLRHGSTLGLKHWAIAAGAVRSAVWDSLHGFARKTFPTDIDFIFYDTSNTEQTFEQELAEKLRNLEPRVDWEPVNQATIHTYINDTPYTSLEHAMSRWAETATAIGVYLDSNDSLKYYAPHGLDDLMNMIFRPHLVTPRSKEVYLDRIAKKNFKAKWPKITILMP